MISVTLFVPILWFSYIHSYWYIQGFIANPHNDQLLVGRALHQYFQGHGFNSVQAWIFIFRPYFHYCLSRVHYCKDCFHVHFLNRSSHNCMIFIYSQLLIACCFKGVVIKYNEPIEARKPRTRWRLYPFKGEEAMCTYLKAQKCFVLAS